VTVVNGQDIVTFRGYTDSKMQITNCTDGYRDFDFGRRGLFFRELLKAWAFIKKDMKISVGYKLQFIFQFFQIFFSVSLIYFIGRMVSEGGGNSHLSRYGSDYFSFALVGLVMNSYFRTGLVRMTSYIRQIMNQGTLEAMCACPMRYSWLMLCSTLWQFLFDGVRVVFYFLCGYILFGLRLPEANWLLAVFVVVLSAPIFLMFGLLASSILVVVKRGDPINWLFSSLGALLAGMMFPVSVFPGWLQRVSFFFPLTHSLEAMRRCLLTGANFGEVWVNLVALFCFIVVLIPVTVFVNGFCMRQAKKCGAFSTH